jgi:ATP-dependent DNA helicase PIF1
MASSRTRRPRGAGAGGLSDGPGFAPRVEDHTDPGFALTLHTPAVVSRLNHCSRVSASALDRMMHTSRPRRSRRHGSSASASSSSSSSSEDEADLTHNHERRQRGGLLAILTGAATRPGPPHGDRSLEGRQDEAAEAAEAAEGAFMAGRRAWGGWRPYMAHVDRCPEEGRRFTVADAALAGLSPEQLQAVRVLEAGLSCFVTGPGGTGKSLLIRVVREAAEAAGLRVRVTASTGIAARNIGGTTLHRVIGWGLMRGLPPAELGRRVAGLRDPDDGRIRRWAETDLLIVDEISMLSIATLQQADAAARAARERSGVGDDRRPFGGIQLLFLGDFAQLTMGEEGAGPEAADSPAPAFAHPAWARFVPLTVELRTIFRQRDAGFRDLLNRVRLGRPLRGDILTLNAVGGSGGSGGGGLSGDTEQAAPAPAAFPDLCAFRVVAAELNAARITALRHASAQTAAYPPRGTDEALAAAAAQGGGIAEPVELCIGARVLLTKNLDQDRGLVNGSLGEVVGFAPPEASDAGLACCPYPLLPVVRWEGVEEPHTVPPVTWQPDDETGGAAAGGGLLRPAGAIVMTADANTLRVPSESPIPTEAVPARGQKRPRKGKPAAPEPGPAAVTYMPLLCAWALTVHRAQGMTLNAARIHGASMRTPALLYTALSRLRGMDGLRIRGSVSEANVVALPEVVRYYDALRRLVDATAAGGGEDEEEDGLTPSEAKGSGWTPSEAKGSGRAEGQPGESQVSLSQLHIVPPSQQSQASCGNPDEPAEAADGEPGEEDGEPVGEPEEAPALAVVPSEILANLCSRGSAAS